MIRFSCPGCGAVYSVTDDKAGKTGKCPKCQTPFTIPAAEAPAPASPPPVSSSNPFADLSGDDAAPRKKKAPSKADLDDDRPKKKPARRDDEDDEDDRPRKKSRRDEDDDYDDAPKKKKPARRDEEEDDYDDRPKKKARRDDEDDDDRPKKKPSRAVADDEDDYDDRPRKKGRGRRDDDYDDDDDYDRPRKKKGKSGLLLTAAILHIVAAALYIPCGVGSLFFGGLVGLGGDAVGASGRVGGTTIKPNKNNPFDDREFRDAMQGFETLEKAGGEIKAVGTVMQILGVLALLGGIIAIPAAVAGFTRKKWFVVVTLVAGGMFVLLALIRLITSFMYILLSLGFGDIFTMLLLPLAYGVVVIMAAMNQNVKRVLS